LNRCWSTQEHPRAPRPEVHLLGMSDAAGAETASRGPAVFLTPRSALIGPGGAGEHGPCTNCLVPPRQQIRPPAERAVLETGGEFLGGSPTPHLTDFAVDAIHHLYTDAVDGGRPTTTTPRTAEVVELSLASLTVRSFPLLADAGCRRCADPVPTTAEHGLAPLASRDRKSTRLNSSHVSSSYADFCLKKKTTEEVSRKVGTIPAERSVAREEVISLAVVGGSGLREREREEDVIE